MALSKEELREIIDSSTSTAHQRATAQALLNAQALVSVQSGEFDLNAELLASHVRSFSDPAFRATYFRELREKSVKDPVWSASFTKEREHLRAKRRVYGPNGGDVIGYEFDAE